MLALFSRHRSRFARSARSRRSRTAAAGITPERLEQRLALAGDTFARPMLEQVTALVVDQSMGPNPVVLSKSQVVGNDVNSFVVTAVPEGSVVEKWDSATNAWIDVSTKPASSNPLELMRLLAGRVIHEGDKIQWRPQTGHEGLTQQAFEMIGWDPASGNVDAIYVPADDPTAPAPGAPAEVQNLAVAPTGVGELTVSWEAPATGDVTSYAVTMTTTTSIGVSATQVQVTSNTSAEFTGLSPANAYAFAVTASNPEGTSPAEQGGFGQQPPIVQPWIGRIPAGQLLPDFKATEASLKGTNPLVTWSSEQKRILGEELTITGPLTTGLDGSIWMGGGKFVQQITNTDGVWTPQPAINTGVTPNAIITAHDGSIWVGGNNFQFHNDSRLLQIAQANGEWTVQTTLSMQYHPDYLAQALDGSIWVASGKVNEPVTQVTNTDGQWGVQNVNLKISSSDNVAALAPGLDGSIWAAITTPSSNNAALVVGNPGALVQITNAGGEWTVQPQISVGINPVALTAAFDGSMWIGLWNTDPSSLGKQGGAIPGAVQQLTKSDGEWTPQPQISVGDGPGALSTGMDGSIWVANGMSNSVQQIIHTGGQWTAQQPISMPSQYITTGLDGSIWSSSGGSVSQIIAAPNPPRSLSAAVGPGADQITLAWQPSEIDGGSPAFSYTTTVVQGDVTQIVTTSDPSCTFDGLALGGGPTYFTVTATNFAGESRLARLLIDAAGNPISLENLGIGIVTDGTVFTGSGFDGNGNAYSWEAMGEVANGNGGARIGNQLTWNGVTFEIGSPNAPDFTQAAGQTIAITAAGNVINLAAAAVNGSQQNQPITLNFSDGSTGTWNQSFSDWCDPQYFVNETILSTQQYRDTASGGSNDTTNHLYAYSVVIPDGPNGQRTLESITLPTNANLRILDIQMAQASEFYPNGFYNAYGIARGNGWNTPNNAGFDSNGNYYDSELLGPSIAWKGAIFGVGASAMNEKQQGEGINNIIRNETVVLPIDESFRWLYLSGAGSNGDQMNQVLTLTFTDGSTSTWVQSFTDWCNSGNSATPIPFAGEAIIQQQSQRVDQHGNAKNVNNWVYGYTYEIPAGKTLQSVTLPNNQNVGILGVALV